MSIDLSKLHGPAQPMRFKVVVKVKAFGMEAGTIIDAEGICVDAGAGIVHVCPDNSDRFAFRIDEVEVIQSIGRKDMDGMEVYHGDVLELDQAGFVSSERAAVRWDILGMNLRLVTRNGSEYPLSRTEQGRKIGNVFADKTLMEGETSNV